MSEQLGLGEVISDSLGAEAQIVRAMGNDWTVPMRAALEIALSGGHEYRVGETFAGHVLDVLRRPPPRRG